MKTNRAGDRMKKIRLIATDLDGTLLQDDHMTVSERNKQALKRASEAGVEIVIASGRTWAVLSKVAKDLGLARYALISNGASVVDVSTGEFLFHKNIPFEEWAPIYEYLKELGYPFCLYCDGESYMEASVADAFHNPTLSKGFVADLKSRANVVDKLTIALKHKGIEKFSVLYVDKEKYEQVCEKLATFGKVQLTSSLPYNVEINAMGADKGGGLKTLSRQLGISREEVMAFGDAENDLSMLEWACWSFAMGNATESVKKAAKYVTKTNMEDGIAEAVNKFFN